MAEVQRTDGEAIALSGQAVGPGVPIPVTYAKPFLAAADRALGRLADAVAPAAALEVYADDGGALCIGVRPGRIMDGDTAYAYAGADAVAVVDDATNYVYLTLADLAAGNTVSVNQIGFPDPSATPHVPLAVCAAAGGVLAIADIAPYTSRSLLRVLSGMTAADANILTSAGNADALHAHALSSRRPATAGALVYFDGRPVDGQLLTIAGRKYEYDTDSNYPESGGNVLVDANGSSSLAEDIVAFAAAINADPSAVVIALSEADLLRLYAKTAGAAGNAITVATNLTGAALSNSHLTDGADAELGGLYAMRHVVSAGEAAAGVICLYTGLTTIDAAVVSLEHDGLLTPIGVSLAYDGPCLRIGMYDPAWAAGDLIVVWAFGVF